MILAEYLTRLSIIDIPKPSLETLSRLQRQHVLKIPFENLDIYYGNPIIIDVDKIYHKVVRNGRGGFCYELNSQFNRLLLALGFETKLISGRVFNPKTSVFGQEFDHLIIWVTLNGKDYLADVGFGNFTFNPLVITSPDVQSDDRGNFIIEQIDDTEYRVDRVVEDQHTPVYKFTSVERTLTDFESMCSYHQKHPDSHFTDNRMISLARNDGKVSIVRDMFKLTKGDQVEEIAIRDEAHFAELLWQYFKINANEI